MTLDLHHLGSMRVTPLALSHKKEKNKPYFDCKVFYKRPENYCEILALKGFNSFIISRTFEYTDAFQLV